MKTHNELVEIYNKIPIGVDILMTHEAPDLAEVGYTHLDDGTKIPYHCYALTEAIKRKTPTYALCGHVHSGNHELTGVPVFGDAQFSDAQPWTIVNVANVSILDESYSINYKPLTFEL